MYITKTRKQKRTQHLDNLARESGRCYSKVVSLVRKTHTKKGFWIPKGGVQKYMRHREYNLHSQTVQACVDSYFDSLDSYFEARKSNPDARPPKRTPRHFKVRWKSGAIRIKDRQLILSNGLGREPVILDGITEKPNYIEMYFKRGHYYFALVYKVDTLPKSETGIIVAIDMGEIHPIVSFDGDRATLYNGRFLRSLVRYRNKFKAQIQRAMDTCKKRSRKWYRLLKVKRRTLEKLAAQIKDAEHKITSRFISDCQRAKADTIVIGDIKGIRNTAKFSKKSNQKIHQWAFSRIQQKICYKAALVGIKVVFESEAYTSQTCPHCGHRKKPANRNYHCKKCGFKYHRDGVGAINLYNKVSGVLNTPVSRDIGNPLSVRFNWHLSSLGLTPRNLAISKERIFAL
ncbi:hypothetical protein C6496_17510 [Candidatus Poribacteria bacterium]|nr:MAG: hypothetical protein C6496_17510 [Candidatus Poribacteria bacterium]